MKKLDFNKPTSVSRFGHVETSDGQHANYYDLPPGATQLQDLISHRNMNAQIGEIMRSCYRYGLASHSPKLREVRKILFYAQAELERLERLEQLEPVCEGRR